MKRLLVLTLAITGVLAAGCIVRFGTFDDDTNHFVGLASNLTNVDVVAASVQVDFLNSSGAIVYTQNVDPCTRTLQKHKDSPVEADAPASISARSVRTTVRPLTFGQKNVADLDVDEDDVAVTVSGDETEVSIEGPIDANEDLENVHVCAALFDNDDNVLAVGKDFSPDPSDMEDGDSGTFEVVIDTEDIDVGDIDQYQLWIDAIADNEVTAPVVVGPENVDIESAVHDTGEISPGAAAAVGDFVDAGEAIEADNDYATATTTGGDPKTHVYINYPIEAEDIPDDADIVGIEVRLDWFVNTVGDNSSVAVELSWDAGVTWTTAKTSTDLSTTEDTTILGNDDDTWGHNWDASTLTNANFRVRVTFDSDAEHIFSLDWVPVTIYYTES